MTDLRRAIPAVAAVAGVALLTSCGSSHGSGATNSGSTATGEASKPAAQIVTDAQDATGATSSVHIAGKVNSGGSVVQLDVVADHGRGGGTIVEGGMTFQTVLDGKTVYLRADAATWTKAANASVAGLLAEKWLKTTTDNQDFSEFGSLLDISQLVSQFSAHGTLTKGSVTTYDGVSVVPVTDHETDGGTVYVANTGSPYIVALVGTGNNGGSLHFNQYGTATVPAVPAGAIDLNALEHGTSSG